MIDALEPFPLTLYRRFLSGVSVEQLSAEFGISAARVDLRLRAAALYDERRKTVGGLARLNSRVESLRTV